MQYRVLGKEEKRIERINNVITIFLFIFSSIMICISLPWIGINITKTEKLDYANELLREKMVIVESDNIKVESYLKVYKEDNKYVYNLVSNIKNNSANYLKEVTLVDSVSGESKKIENIGSNKSISYIMLRDLDENQEYDIIIKDVEFNEWI